jgi:hypothetical protein
MIDPDPPRSHVMPVVEDHQAYAMSYCEMCGGEVDRNGECAGEDRDHAEMADLVAIVGTLARWALRRPLHMRILASRVEHPHYTIRDVAEVVGVGRSQVHAIMAEISGAFPALKPVLGFASCRSRAQARRRTNERGKND